jgi:hypothetical protein
MNEMPYGTILLDALAGPDEQFDVSFLERNDHPVIVCHGPAAGTTCPLLAEGACAKYAAAHGIVFELDLDRAQHRAIVARYRELNPDVPIRVVVRGDQAQRYHDLIGGVQVWTHTPNVADLDGFAAEVEAADRYATALQTHDDRGR